MLCVRVLGALEIESGGEQLALPTRRPARALLGWLALNPGVHARSTVAGRLWPNVLEDSARASLRTALSALRGAIGPEAARALVSSRDQLGLAEAAEVWVDVREFERLAAEGRAQEALELCRGELLEGLDDDWVLSARDEHRARQAEALRELADGAARAGDHDAAVSLARRRAALDPLDEAAHRDLMHRLAAAGDRGGALAAYERLVERLRRELGIAVSPATRTLAGELRAAAPRERPPRPASERLPLPARLQAARRRGPLLGRELELARLRALWERSAREGRGACLVTGEPGIGKTRLVAELAAELHSEGAVVLYGRAEEDLPVSYQPLVESLRKPMREAVVLPAEIVELAGLLPEAAERLGGAKRAPVTSAPAPGARLRLFEAVGAALDAVAAARPLLLALDDLHWAEHSTVRLLVHVAGRPGPAPRMLLLSYRDTDVEGGHPLAAGLADLRRELPVERIELEGLDLDAVTAMIEHLPGSRPQPATVQTLCDRTRGNPFFIEELLSASDHVRAGWEADWPPTGGVIEAVTHRVDRLGPEAHALLTAGAVAGPEFERTLVAEVLGLHGDTALDVLDAAVRSRLLLEVPDESGRYAFAHALVRDALIGSLTAARGARLHELIAEALEAPARRDPDRYLVTLAGHALEAAAGGGDPERAADLAERAAAQAGTVLAYEDAAALLRRALAVLDRRGGAPERRAELLCSLAEALQRAGARAPARDAAHAGREIARASGRADIIARATLAAGGVGVTILDVDQQRVRDLDAALAAVGRDVDKAVLRVRLLARLAIELAYDPDPARREQASGEALALARRIDDPAPLAAALGARHVALWGPDHTHERLRLATEMLELAEAAGDRELALQARNWRVTDYLEAGDGPSVRAELDAYATLASEARLAAYSWYVPMWRATLAFLEGRIGEGRELSSRAHELGRRAGDANADVFLAEHQLLRLVIEERFDEADPAALGVEDTVSARAGRSPARHAYRLTSAWLLAERGQLDQARQDFEAATAGGLSAIPRDVNWLAAMCSAAHACALLDDSRRARELRTLLAPYSDRIVVAARGSAVGGSVAYLLARLATTCREYQIADQLFEEAVRREEHAGAPVFAIRDRAHHGQMLRAAGQADRAAEMLQQAARQAHAVGLRTVAGEDFGRHALVAQPQLRHEPPP